MLNLQFDADVASTVGAGVTQVCNQGNVDATNLTGGPIDSDDPGVGGMANPTCEPLVANPIVGVTKIVTSSTPVDPGNTVTYQVEVSNTGDQDAANVIFADDPSTFDPNITLVDGTVTTTQGTIVSGNGGGDTTVSVDIGTLAPRCYSNHYL